MQLKRSHRDPQSPVALSGGGGAGGGGAGGAGDKGDSELRWTSKYSHSGAKSGIPVLVTVPLSLCLGVNLSHIIHKSRSRG